MKVPLRRFPLAHDFVVGGMAADRSSGRIGKVIALADDAPELLVRWNGGRICDWKKAEDLIHVSEAGDAYSLEGESCPATK